MTDSTDVAASSFRAEPLAFTGRGAEFFRIWIVNLCLTILTLGIYSAWAKVRTQHYFYGNTWLAGARMEYLAEPIQILRGRLIAVGALVVYAMATSVFPWSDPLFLLAFLIVLPWVIVQSLRFRARMSAYRNLRFRFHGRGGGAARVYLLWPLLSALTLGLVVPVADHARNRYRMDNLAYGRSRFAFSARVGQFYRMYVPVLAALILVPALGGWLGYQIGSRAVASMSDEELSGIWFQSQQEQGGSDAESGTTPGSGEGGGQWQAPGAEDLDNLRTALIISWVTGGVMLGLFLVLYLIRPYLDARRTNLVWRHTRLGPHAFSSRLRARDLFWIYISNYVAVLLSLGLLYPWSQVRLARYRLTRMALMARGSLDEFLADEAQGPTATGEELGDVFGVELGF